MKNVGRLPHAPRSAFPRGLPGTLVLAGLLVVGFTAPRALAQDDPPVKPTLDVLRKPVLKGIKPGSLPGARPRLPPMVKPGDLAPLAQKVAPGGVGGVKPALKARRLPPGAKDDAGKGAAGEGEKGSPQWQQVEEKEDDDEPTLSKDFIKNCARLKPGVKVRLDIYDEEIEAVVKLIACLTGKNIVMGKPIKGKKITIYSPSLVNSAEALRVFYSALEANGLTIRRNGKFWHVVEAKGFETQPGVILPPEASIPNEDRMVTQLLRLSYVDASEMNEVISGLLVQKSIMGDTQGSGELKVVRVEHEDNGELGQLELSGGRCTPMGESNKKSLHRMWDLMRPIGLGQAHRVEH